MAWTTPRITRVRKLAEYDMFVLPAVVQTAFIVTKMRIVVGHRGLWICSVRSDYTSLYRARAILQRPTLTVVTSSGEASLDRMIPMHC